MERCDRNGDLTPNWIDSLKLALINENFDDIVHLYDSMPEFSTTEEMKEASALIESAIFLLTNEKNKTADILKRIEMLKKYGNGSIGHPTVGRLSKTTY